MSYYRTLFTSKKPKQHISKLDTCDSRELQIIAHHIWRVRNKYFGHGDLVYNNLANANIDSTVQIAKQVLVARYLCRRLIDAQSPSNKTLVREMGLFSEGYSGNFTGRIDQLEDSFRADYDRRVVKIYDENGDRIDDYTIR